MEMEESARGMVNLKEDTHIIHIILHITGRVPLCRGWQLGFVSAKSLEPPGNNTANVTSSSWTFRWPPRFPADLVGSLLDNSPVVPLQRGLSSAKCYGRVRNPDVAESYGRYQPHVGVCRALGVRVCSSRSRRGHAGNLSIVSETRRPKESSTLPLRVSDT